jgi:hypothetical protein
MFHKVEHFWLNDEVRAVEGNYSIFLEEKPRFAGLNPLKNVR